MSNRSRLHRPNPVKPRSLHERFIPSFRTRPAGVRGAMRMVPITGPESGGFVGFMFGRYSEGRLMSSGGVSELQVSTAHRYSALGRAR